MKLKIIYGVFIAVFLHCNVTAQMISLKRQNILQFDEAGKLVSFPNIVVRENQDICFKVKVPVSYLDSQLNNFVGRLDSALTYLKSPEVFENYRCYFEKKKEFKFCDFITAFEAQVAALKNLKVCNGYEEFKKISTIEEVPTAEFFKHLFEEQYEIQVFQSSRCTQTIKLIASKFACKDSCVTFEADCKKMKDLNCEKCDIKDFSELDVRLIRTDPWAQTVMDWFENQNAVLSGDINKIKGGFETMSKHTFPSDTFMGGHSNTVTLKKWFPKWFWYTKGRLSIDPFSMLQSEERSALEATIKKYEEDLAKLKFEKDFTDSTVTDLRRKAYNIDLANFLKRRSISLAKRIERISELKKKAEQQVAVKPGLKSIFQPKLFLNDVLIEQSFAGKVHPQKQFDAARNYQLVADTKREVDRVREIPENERPYLLLYNVDSSHKIDVSEKRMDFDDEEEFTKLLKEELAKIDFSELATSSLLKLENFSKSFSAETMTSGASAKKACEGPITCNDPNPILLEIAKLAKLYSEGKLTLFYEKSPFITGYNKDPLLKTIKKEFGKDFAAPFTDSISIKQIVKKGEEKHLLKTYINTGKLRFVQIAAGIAFTQSPATVVNIDTAGSGFRVSSSDNKARAVVGFKVYPFQQYKRDSRLIPRYIQHRLSVFGGFEIIHPLDNFYIGGCYDIVPGLGFSVGKNFYLQTNYKIENNVVTDTFRKYKGSGAYYSVVINPKLFVQFVKLFFK